MMKQVTAIFLCAISVLLIWVGFGAPNGGETHALSAKTVIRIGATLPMSGRLAFVGEDVRRGVMLAAKQYSSQTLKFQVTIDDNPHDGKQAASSVHKLIEQDKVDVIVSLWDMADIVAPIANTKNVPHFAIRWDPQVAHDYSNTFTVESTYFSYIDALIGLLRKVKVKNAAVLTEEGQGWVLASSYLKKQAAQNGISIVADGHFDGTEMDHRSVVLRLLSRNPEMVVLLSNPPHTELLVKAIKDTRPLQRFTGYFENLKDPALVTGIPFVAQLQVAPWFESEFLFEYGEKYITRAPHGYDIVMLINEAQKRSATKLEGKALIRAISQISGLHGATGTLNVGPDRNIEGPCVLEEFRDGRFVISG